MVLNWICILERIPEIFHSWEKNVEWDVPKISVERHVEFYGCCPEPYPDIAFSIHLTRKPSYYITNIIVPSLIITVLVVLGFILPVSSGEKVSLEITVMLAMSVFQLLVADHLPPSADSTPWIGKYPVLLPKPFLIKPLHLKWIFGHELASAVLVL